jgi:hypothetical protein
MNTFELKTVNNALQQVQSDDDALALAGLVMKLSRRLPHNDVVWERAEEQLLGALIKHEVETSKDRTFSNILEMLRCDLDAALQYEADWLAFKQSTSEKFRRAAANGLEMRLMDLRLLSKLA